MGATGERYAATPLERVLFFWLCALVIFNSLLDAPLSDTFGTLWRFIGEFLTTGFATLILIAIVASPGWRARLGILRAPLVAFIIFAIVQGLWLSVHPVVTTYAVRSILRLPLVAIGAAFVARDKRQWRALVALLFGIGCLEAGILLVQYFTPDFSGWEVLRPSEDIDVGMATVSLSYEAPYPNGTLPRYNHAAEFMLPIALLSVVLYARTRGATRPPLFVVLLLCAGTAISCSRTAQLCLLLGAAIVLMHRRNLFVVCIIAAVLGGASYSCSEGIDYSATTESGNVVDRYLSFFAASYWEQMRDGGDMQRWPAAFEGTRQTLNKRPLLGTGLGTIGTALTDSAFVEQPFAEYGDYSRLTWLEDNISLRALSDVGWICILAQGGLVGLAMFIWIFRRFSVASTPLSADGSFAPLLARMVLLAFFAFNLSSCAFLSRSFLSSAAVILGLAVAAARSNESRNDATSDEALTSPAGVP